jgi:UvrD-like helicase C-terminal domain
MCREQRSPGLRHGTVPSDLPATAWSRGNRSSQRIFSSSGRARTTGHRSRCHLRGRTNNLDEERLAKGARERIHGATGHCRRRSGVATTQVEDRVEEIGSRDWTSIDLAYAITVHKAQGSQFDSVILPISRSRLLDRARLYTAITRAVRKVLLIGDRAAFERVASPHSHGREVGSALRLNRA